jgi:hypothetical protein
MKIKKVISGPEKGLDVPQFLKDKLTRLQTELDRRMADLKRLKTELEGPKYQGIRAAIEAYRRGDGLRRGDSDLSLWREWFNTFEIFKEKLAVYGALDHEYGQLISDLRGSTFVGIND